MKECQITRTRESDATVSTDSTIIPYRRKGEVVEEMLRAIKDDSGRTHCMYQSNLSHKLLNSYLAFLEKRGLIKESEERKLFLTEKGETLYDIVRCVNGVLSTDTNAKERRNLLSQLNFEKEDVIESPTRRVGGKYRSRDEIFHSVLNTCKNPAPITRITRGAGTSYANCQHLLDVLEKRGLIEKSTPKKEYLDDNPNTSFLYHSTKQGKQLRIALSHVNSILYSANPIDVSGLRRI